VADMQRVPVVSAYVSEKSFHHRRQKLSVYSSVTAQMEKSLPIILPHLRETGPILIFSKNIGLFRPAAHYCGKQKFSAAGLLRNISTIYAASHMP